ncbi:MAG: 4Fe-4S dicluster domain-containing protein [Methylocystaceae bacterium]
MANLWSRLDYRNWFVPGVINNPCFPAMDNNIKCQACVDSCSAQAISKQWGTIQIDPERCNYCGDCYNACPGDLIGIQGLDKLLVKVKRDREKGADTLYLFCDHHRHGDVQGAVQMPTYKYLSPEVLFWAAALGYTQVALPSPKACQGCRENCYQGIIAGLENVNIWLQSWNKKLELTDYSPRSNKSTDRQLSRRELFTGLGWKVKSEVAGLVVEELESRLTRVLPRTEQGYMRRQTLKAMAVKLLPPAGKWPRIAIYPEVSAQCTGCRVCSKQCPTRALVYEAEGLLVKPWLCNGCNFCGGACPQGYITLQPVEEQEHFFLSRRYQFAREVD